MMEHVKLASRVPPLDRKTTKYHAYSKKVMPMSMQSDEQILCLNAP